MLMISENERFMSKVLSALNDRRDDRKLSEIIFRTYDRIKPETVKDKLKTKFNVILSMSKAIMDGMDSGVELSDEDLDIILKECESRTFLFLYILSFSLNMLRNQQVLPHLLPVPLPTHSTAGALPSFVS